MTRTLFYEPFVLAMPIGHALARRHAVNASDLRGDDMVLVEDGTTSRAKRST